VIGVGLNLSIEPHEFPPELRATATSVGGADPGAALAALNQRLGAWVEAPEEEVLAEFRRRDALRGREISWQNRSGTAEGIDDKGNLLVRTADGEAISLGAGEVHLRLDPPSQSGCPA
jgi:BirA family biotin operon repressor/biotin-[acetyl-CoA-carboxylase] ligase